MPGQRTILLIDYDPKSIEDTTAQLRRAGYRVEVAGDGQSGLEVFAKLAPDLVLIEPMVPKKHGFQVCHEIKSTPRGKTTPVLITTAFYRGRKHRTEAQERYGCDGYLEKPISEELLLSTCRSFLIDTQSPPLPVPEQEPRARRAEAAPFARGTVISFPELPLVEEREPARLVALDDLSDEEIQDRLDDMILEESTESSSADPAAAPPPLPTRTAPVAADLPRTPIAAVAAARSADATLAEPAQDGRSARAPDAPARAIDPVLRRPDRPARERRHADRAHPAKQPHTRSRLPMWIGLAAVACVLAGAGLLWAVRKTSGPAGAAAALLEPVESRRTSADAERAAAPDSPAPGPTTEGRASAPSAEGSSAAPDLSASSAAPAAPQPAQGATLPNATADAPRPSESATSRAPSPAAAGAARALPPAQTDRPRGAPENRSAAPAETRRPTADSSTAPPSKPSRAQAEPAGPPAAETQAAVEAAPLRTAPDPESLSGTGAETAATAAAAPRASRGDLVPLGEVDVAPRPVDKPAPEYPRAAAQLRQEGTVTLRVLVGEDGRVERAEFDSGTKHRALQTEAIRAVERWTYEPATKDGVPVKVWISEAVTFRL